MTDYAQWSTFVLSAACLGISITISTLEYLSILPAFDTNGALSWRILGTRSAPPKIAILRRLWDALMNRHGMAIILLVRLACTIVAVVGLVFKAKTLPVYALSGVLVTGMLLTYRSAFGTDGSDQMSNIVTAGLLVAAVPGSPVWRVAGFGFIAFQSCLSYVSAGIAKALSQVWRNGTALHKIMNTGTYGNERLAEMLRQNRRVSFLMCWFVIIFEMTFPLALLLPAKATLLLLAVGCFFHLGIAVFMGLNTFFWSFLASYPAIWICNSYIRKFMI